MLRLPGRRYFIRIRRALFVSFKRCASSARRPDGVHAVRALMSPREDVTYAQLAKEFTDRCAGDELPQADPPCLPRSSACGPSGLCGSKAACREARDLFGVEVE
jgi:hypothetical protein